MAHTTSTEVQEALEAAEWSAGKREHFITLDQGDSTWNPASTKGDIHGPATVQYVEFSDGGVTVRQFPR